MSGIGRNSAGMEVYSLDLPTGVGIGRNAAGAEIYLTNLPTGLGGMIARNAAGAEVYLPGITGGTPTPTPAPVFTTQPSISPGSGTAGSTLFTASDGVASNTTGYTRRWLLSGTSIGTGTTVTPASAGSLVLEVTATGAGGPTIANSAAVTVAAAAIPWVLATGSWDDAAPWDDTQLWKDAA